jgi:transcriptional regulator
MSSKEIRNTLNLLESLDAQVNEDKTYTQTALDLIENIFKMYKKNSDPAELSYALKELASMIPNLPASKDEKRKTKIEEIRRVLLSIAKQLDPKDATSIKSGSDNKLLIAKLLRSIYSNIIATDSDFETLAKTNSEAKEKIVKLSSMIYASSKDNDIKRSSKLIYNQAKQIE